MKLQKHLQISLALLLLCSMQSLFAHDYEWPVDTPSISNLIGMKKSSESFEPGIIFEDANEARATHPGTVLMTIDTKYRHRNFPSALGNAVIFIDDTGLQTVYGNLGAIDHLGQRLQSDAKSPIAHSGNSGWEKDRSLSFQMIDTKKHVYLNPQFLLPPVHDRVSPEIDSIILKASNDALVYPQKGQSIRQGRYKLYARVTDYHSVAKNIPLAPFSVSVEVNGISITELSFEVLSVNNGMVHLGTSGLMLKTLYDGAGRLYLGTLSLVRGSLNITISARDISANVRKVVIENTVR